MTLTLKTTNKYERTTPNKDNGLQARWIRTPAPNSGLAKVAVQCSADPFVVNQTLVLRISICGKIPHLRQAPLVSGKHFATHLSVRLHNHIK